MKVSKFWQAAMVVMLLAVLSAPLVEAQGRGRNRQEGHGFDPGTVVTVTGTVEEVVLSEDGRGSEGMHVILNVEGESMEAHLGPTSYIFPSGLVVEKGDRVTVTGSKVMIDGQPAFIASEISKGDFSLALRNEAGIPAWRGEGPRAAEGGRGQGRGALASEGGKGRGYGAQAGEAGRGQGYGAQAGEAGRGRGYGARVAEAGEGQGYGAGPRAGHGRGMGRASTGSDEEAIGRHGRCRRGATNGGGKQARYGRRVAPR